MTYEHGTPMGDNDQLDHNVPLDTIRIDGGTQPRIAIDEATVTEYADALRNGAVLPPLSLFFDGEYFWLADGFHRYHAYLKLEIECASANIRTGSRREAVLYAVGANTAHGLRRTNDDKRRAVLMLLDDPEWSGWSDNQIAKACAVSHPFVGSVRASLEAVTSEEPAARTYTTKHGTTATMKTANIGKVRQPLASDVARQEPDVKPGLDAPELEVATPRLPPEQGAVAVTDVEALMQENAELREQLDDIKRDMAETLADNEMMARVFESNDQVKASMAEVARYRAVAEQAKRNWAARSHEFIERARNVAYWMKRAKTAEKQLAEVA